MSQDPGFGPGRELPDLPPPLPPLPRPGLPWEREGPALQRFIDTLKLVLTDPTKAFSDMKREGGLGPPLIYGVIGTVSGALMSVIYNLFMSGVGLGFPGGFGGSPFGSTSSLIFVPLVMICALFLASGIYHLMLMLLNAAKFPYETTFRVVAYSVGSTGPLGIIPICGGVIGAIWGLVVTIIGLAQAQETTTGKSALSVLVPGVLCCGLIMLFWGALIAFIIGASALGSR